MSPRTTACFMAALAVVLVSPSAAQGYPTKPIRLIVPAPSGSATDIRGRWIAGLLTRTLGQTIVVDNRGGAGGLLATEVAAKSAPDGYTLVLVHLGTLAAAPYMYSRIPYDPIGDFVPVTQLSLNPFLLAVHPSVPAKSVAELLRLAREKPGELNYGSPGSGSPPHLAGELFRIMANIVVTHIPYKGGGAAVTDLAGGRLAYTFDNLSVQQPFVTAGKTRALAMTGRQRLASLPEIPTVAESGVPGYEFQSWMGISFPARTPGEIVARLNREITKILGTSEAREWLAAQGAEPGGSSSQEFAAYIKAEHARWGPIIRKAGIKAD